jgi:hypothetical protein
MLAADGLHPSSKGGRIRWTDDKPRVIDGPFAEARELIAGYLGDPAPSHDAVIERFKPCPPPTDLRQGARPRGAVDRRAGGQGASAKPRRGTGPRRGRVSSGTAGRRLGQPGLWCWERAHHGGVMRRAVWCNAPRMSRSERAASDLPPFTAAFTVGTRFAREHGGPIEMSTRQIGELLRVPSGRVVVGDPGLIDFAAPPPPFAREAVPLAPPSWRFTG